MATYIQGLTDYIPEIQPFKPDLNFYAQALSIKQNRYDAAMKNISNIYGTLLYSPLSAKDNIIRRDNFFKTIEQDLHKISAMDLSLPQNQAAAMAIFEPLINDKAIAHDMAFTRYVNNQMQRGETFKYCVDPDKCGGKYNEESMAHLQGFLSDYDKAFPDERLKMSPPDFFADINITKKAIEWVNDQGLIVESVTPDGAYFVTKQNGMEMLVPLQQVLTAVYGSDYNVRGMFQAKAYVQRKNYIQENLQRFNGDENAAEEDWFKRVTSETGQALVERAKMSEGPVQYAKWKKKALEEKIRRDGIAIDTAPENVTLQEWISSIEDEEIGKVSNQYYKNLLGELSNMNSDPRNRMMMRNKIDNIAASGMLEEKIFQTATSIAQMNNNITKIEVNDVALEHIKHAHDLARIKYQNDLDFKKTIALKMFDLAPELAASFSFAGFGPDANGKLLNPDPDQASGVGQNTFGQYAKAMMQGEQYTNTYEQQGINSIVNFADGVINNPNAKPEEVLLAKRMKKNIFGSNYDENSNRYMKNGMPVNDWKSAGYNDKQMYDFYSNSIKEFRGNYGLFDDQTRMNFTKSQRNHSYYWAQKMANGEVLKDNSTVIFNNIDMLVGSNVVPSDQKGNFRMLFRKTEDGRYYPKSEGEYVNDVMLQMPKDWSEGKKRERARAMYENQTGIFTSLFNQGTAGTGISFLKDKFRTVDGIFSFNGSVGENGVVVPSKVMFQTDSKMVLMPGTIGMVQLANDMYSFTPGSVGGSKNYLKVLSGNPNGYYTGTEYNEMANDPQAEGIARSFLMDHLEMYNDKDKGLRPKGTFFYKGAAANNSGVEEYHIIPGKEWLDSYKNSKGLVYGQTPEFWMTNGFHIYRDKSKSNTEFTRQFMQHPFDAIMRSGKKVEVNLPNAGSVSFKYVVSPDGKRQLVTDMNAKRYSRDAQGNFVQGPTVTQHYVNDDYQGWSPGMHYNAAVNLLENLEIINSGIMNGSYNPALMERDLQTLLSSPQAELDLGLRTQNSKERLTNMFNERMKAVNMILQSMEGAGIGVK